MFIDFNICSIYQCGIFHPSQRSRTATTVRGEGPALSGLWGAHAAQRGMSEDHLRLRPRRSVLENLKGVKEDEVSSFMGFKLSPRIHVWYIC